MLAPLATNAKTSFSFGVNNSILTSLFSVFSCFEVVSFCHFERLKTASILANKLGKKVIVDAQRDLGSYKNVTSMTPNHPDTEKSVGFEIHNEDDLKRAGKKLLNETNAEAILITCGADGMFVA